MTTGIVGWMVYDVPVKGYRSTSEGNCQTSFLGFEKQIRINIPY